MKRGLLKLILVLSLLFSLGACSFKGGDGSGDSAAAGSDGSAGDQGQGGESTSGGDLIFNGVPAKEYYGQFVSKLVLDCAHQSASGYRSVRADYISLPKTAAGNQVRAEFEVSLDSNGSFQAHYKEYEVVAENGDVQAWNPLHSSDLKGKWSIQQGQLVIGDIGRGMGLKYNGMDVIDFKFSRDISRPGLTGKNPFLGVIIRGLSLEEFEERCHAEADAGS